MLEISNVCGCLFEEDFVIPSNSGKGLSDRTESCYPVTLKIFYLGNSNIMK